MTTPASAGTTSTTAAPPAAAGGTPAGGAAPPPAADAGKAGTTAAPADFLSQPPPQDSGKKDGAPAGDSEKKPEGDKAEGAAAAELELKLPEGVEANPELLNGFKAWAKENNLKGEAAQKVVDLFAKVQQSQAEQAQAARTQQLEAWQQAIQADKEIGGSKFDESKAMAGKALARFVDADTVAFLRSSGLGNHPGLAKAFVKIGQALAEDSVAGTAGALPKGNPEEAFRRSLYTHPTSQAALFPKG